MPTYQDLVSLADLSAVGLRLRPSEGATIAREIALRVARGEFPGIPSPNVLRLASDGRIHIEGPVGSDREVERAARLLEALLPGFEAPPELRVPGALRLVLARALGTLDLPPYQSLQDFADALGRFAAADSRSCISDIYAAYSSARIAEASEVAQVPRLTANGDALQTSELTISDVRRARRATRLTLSDISERTRIPVTLLREFEWGYLANWPSGFYGRTQIVRYARAAGLDERVVVETVLPMLEEQSQPATAVPAMVPLEGEIVESLPAPRSAPASSSTTVQPAAVGETSSSLEHVELVPIAAAPLVRTKSRGLGRRAKWAAALAIPALIAIGVAPAVWNSRPAPAASETQAVSKSTPAGENARVQGGPPATPPATQTPAPVVPAGTTAGPAQARDSAVSRDAADVAPPPSHDAVAARYRPSELTAAGFSPAFATEGSAMFYHADAPARTSSAIMRADTGDDGSILRVTSIVNDKARNFHARPSPDGSRIAFDSDRDGERGVYIADANGDDVRRVTGDGFAAVPSWSPDGRTLAFVRADADRPRVWNIWTMDVATGQTHRITSHRVGQPWGAAWFPDGERIAYSHETRLVVRSLDGGSQRSFNSPVRGRLIRTPAVSPDGKRIMFQVYRDGAWLLDLRDGSMRRVLADPSAEEFTWSPDGRRVAYHSRRSGTWGVWVMLAS